MCSAHRRVLGLGVLTAAVIATAVAIAFGGATGTIPTIVAIQRAAQTHTGSPAGILCFGVAVDSSTVVTAAHCVDGLGQRQLEVVPLRGLEICGSARPFLDPVAVERPDPTTRFNVSLGADILELRLETPLPSVAPVRAIGSSTGTWDMITWGQPGGGLECTGRSIELSSGTLNDCQGLTVNPSVAACVKGVENGCARDSGSPVFRVESGVVDLLGVMSMGIGCNVEGPAVVARWLP